MNDCAEIIAEKDREIADLRRQLARAHARIRDLEALQQQDRKLFAKPSSELSTTDKLVAYRMRREARKAKASGTGVITPYVPKLADELGIGEDAVSKSLMRGAEIGLWERRLPRDENGHTHLHIMPKPELETLDYTPPATPRNHGGKRLACKSCGSENLVRRIICKDCGATQGADKPVNPDDKPTHQHDPAPQVADRLPTPEPAETLEELAGDAVPVPVPNVAILPGKQHQQQQTPAPPCPECGTATRHSPFPGRRMCPSCAKLVDVPDVVEVLVSA